MSPESGYKCKFYIIYTLPQLKKKKKVGKRGKSSLGRVGRRRGQPLSTPSKLQGRCQE